MYTNVCIYIHKCTDAEIKKKTSLKSENKFNSFAI